MLFRSKRLGFAEETGLGRIHLEVFPVKKMFALLAVFALAAVGCDDKKTTAKDKGTTTITKTVGADATVTKVNTVVPVTATKTDTKVVEVTKTVTPKPELPPIPDPKKDEPKKDKPEGK